MNTLMIILLSLAAVVLFTTFATWLMYNRLKRKEQILIAATKIKEKEIINNARAHSRSITKEATMQAKELAFKMKAEFETSTRETRHELIQLEKHVAHREQTLEKKEELITIKDNKANKREEQIAEIEKQSELIRQKTQQIQHQAQAQLERVSQLTVTEAKDQLKESLLEDVKRDMAGEIRRITEENQENAKKEAQRIISLAVGRYAGEVSSEKLIYVYHLPSDDLKGKIIGKEGRNIRAIEASTGVDLIVDDTPETVTISSFDPVRREIARQVIERLIQDGRIHPARIEEFTNKVKKEVKQQLLEDGRQAAYELGIHNLHPEIIKNVGALKLRTSYQQNQYYHCIEVGFLAGAMAAELGADERIARRGGLLHDIGKVMVHTIEGPHAVIGADFCRRYGEKPEVVHCIRAHHEDVPLETVEAHLVQAADTLSGARPGARRENVERYIRRLEEMENIAASFDGVKKCYAIQAGREIRVLVNNQKATDEDAVMLSREIAKKIEEELKYPGQVKVTVIRETRSISVAR